MHIPFGVGIWRCWIQSEEFSGFGKGPVVVVVIQVGIGPYALVTGIFGVEADGFGSIDGGSVEVGFAPVGSGP